MSTPPSCGRPPFVLSLGTMACALLLSACASRSPPPASALVSSHASPILAMQVPSPLPESPQRPADPVLPAELQALTPPTRPTAIDPLRPDVPVALGGTTAAAAEADLWDRVRKGFAMPDLDNERVRGRVQYYSSKPDYLRRMTERGGRYLFHIVEEVQKRGMPTELALLPFVESAFNPQAMSVAKASGMWQFIPSTGKDFSLTQNVFRDDRRDVLASTRAALDYLARLHGMFGDWHLALAAYNCGEGNVKRTLDRARKAGKPTDYSSLNLPAETQLYVPKLQAIKNIVMQPEAFQFSLPPLRNHPYFLSVPIDRDMDVELAARLAEVSLEEFRQLNPQMNRPVILAAGTEQVLLPYDNAEIFLRRLQHHSGRLASWTAWVAPRTLRPAEAAKLVGMDEMELRQINHIPAKMLVKAGSTLLVPRAAHQDDVSEHLADHAMLALAPEMMPRQRVTVRAGKKGESVAELAKRYRVAAADVAAWNNTSVGKVFKPGSAVVVYLPSAPARSRLAQNKAKPVRVAARGTTVKKPAGKTRPVRVAQR